MACTLRGAASCGRATKPSSAARTPYRRARRFIGNDDLNRAVAILFPSRGAQRKALAATPTSGGTMEPQKPSATSANSGRSPTTMGSRIIAADCDHGSGPATCSKRVCLSENVPGSQKAAANAAATDELQTRIPIPADRGPKCTQELAARSQRMARPPRCSVPLPAPVLAAGARW
jgi:hypothetical protein